jgi:hypothetical protein
MNQFFYETRAREKVREVMKEGLTSQELHRSGVSRNGFLQGMPRLIVITAIVLGVLGLIIR